MFITAPHSASALWLPSDYPAIVAEAFISSASKYYSGVKMNTHGRENMSIFQMKNYLLNLKKKKSSNILRLIAPQKPLSHFISFLEIMKLYDFKYSPPRDKNEDAFNLFSSIIPGLLIYIRIFLRGILTYKILS